MTYATLREALYDFFTHNAPLVSDGGYYSSEDVFTALPYAKGRRYFDAVALPKTSLYLQKRISLWLNSKLCSTRATRKKTVAILYV